MVRKEIFFFFLFQTVGPSKDCQIHVTKNNCWSNYEAMFDNRLGLVIKDINRLSYLKYLFDGINLELDGFISS